MRLSLKGGVFLIEAVSVTKKFGDFTAIENLSLTVPKGSIYGLVGYNGAGKTTLLKTVAGVYRPEGGKVLIDGEPVFENEKKKQRLFYVPDDIYFKPYTTMRKMAAFYKGYYPNFSYDTFEKVTSLFGLDPTKRINGFSKGMQRQAEVVLAMSTMPDTLLLDESFDGLDPQKRTVVKELLYDYMRQKDVAILISSHNLHELQDLCDYVGLINGKRIVLNGSVKDLSKGKAKYRLVFDRPVTEQDFFSIPHKRLNIDGSIVTLMALGQPEDAYARLKEMSPLLIEETVLTLEEIFLDEMEAEGHEAKKIFG